MSSFAILRPGFDDEERPSLGSLVDEFDQNQVLAKERIRALLGGDRESFVRGAIQVLKTQCDSRGSNFVIALLVANDLLPSVVCDPSLDQSQATAVVRAAVRVDPMADVALARMLAGGDASNGSPVRMEDAARMMMILEEVSDGNRVLPYLMMLLRHPDQHVRSKATLMIGRRSQSTRWVQRRLGEADPRTRANAVESLWGNDSKAVREVLQAATRDCNNRTAGNALLGLYRLGDCSMIPDLLKMAVNESALFRATAAWVMGESGDPRFAEVLGRMVGDQSSAVRKRAFHALSRIREAASQSHRGHEWCASGRFQRSAAMSGRRQLRMEVASLSGDERPTLLPTQFILTEDGQPVTAYKVEERPSPEAVAVAFIFPRVAGSSGGPWNQAALDCLAWKRPRDLWSWAWFIASDKPEVQVTLAGQKIEFAAAERAGDGDAPLAFTADAKAAAAAFENAPNRMECSDFWGAVRRVVRAENLPAHGQRHLIIYSRLEADTPSDYQELVAAARRALIKVQAISLADNTLLEDLCRRTQGRLQIAASEEDVASLIEDAHLSLLTRYLISYEPGSAQARNLKIRVHAPAGWAEVNLTIPPAK